ncbi:hypothetical protein ACEN9H_07560 [Massilia cellulosiltytica]|uniref:hypothetical protein n=1 Tax=Massilia cellulosiltytica TaxID=2683234 RepID=UPI0039B39DE5
MVMVGEKLRTAPDPPFYLHLPASAQARDSLRGKHSTPLTRRVQPVNTDVQTRVRT